MDTSAIAKAAGAELRMIRENNLVTDGYRWHLKSTKKSLKYFLMIYCKILLNDLVYLFTRINFEL